MEGRGGWWRAEGGRERGRECIERSVEGKEDVCMMGTQMIIKVKRKGRSVLGSE